MLDLLKKMLYGRVRTAEQVDTWQEAIRLAAEPLLQDGSIEERYISAMIKSVDELGPYIVLIPGFAMPHARSENGVIRTSVSLLKLHKGVLFPNDKEVSLLVVLAVANANDHVDLVGDVACLLEQEELLKRLFSAKTDTEIYTYLKELI
jgi:PTS system mannitol-specific IIA component/PTS system ascorbate-specific IIA component